MKNIDVIDSEKIKESIQRTQRNNGVCYYTLSIYRFEVVKSHRNDLFVTDHLHIGPGMFFTTPIPMEGRIGINVGF